MAVRQPGSPQNQTPPTRRRLDPSGPNSVPRHPQPASATRSTPHTRGSTKT
jgi:hypothetical protein